MEDPTVIPAPPIIVKYCPHNFSIESHIFILNPISEFLSAVLNYVRVIRLR